MSKKFLVVGNPIEHSLSPKLHNYWIKKNNIKASYEKKLLEEEGLKKIILEIRGRKDSRNKCNRSVQKKNHTLFRCIN